MSLLHDFADNRNNRDWISGQLDNLHDAIQWGLRHGGTSDQALTALLYLYPYVIMTGKLDAWSGVLYDALLLAQDTQDSQLQTRIWEQMGHSHVALGKGRAARAAFETMLERAEEQEKEQLVLGAYIGLLNSQMLHHAEELSPDDIKARVLPLVQEMNSPTVEAEFHQALAVAYTYFGDFPAALGHGQMAYVYFYRLDDSLGMGRAMFTLSQTYRLIRRFDQAMETLQWAKTYYLQTNIPGQYSALAYAEGILLIDRREYQAAKQWLELAVREARSLEHPHYIAKHIHGLGLAEIFLENYETARQHLRTALAIWLQEKNLFEEANVNYALGFLEFRSNNSRNAYVYYQRALRLCREISNLKAGESLARSIQKDMTRLDHPCD